MTTTRTHYLGSAFARQTACGRFVPEGSLAVRTSDDEHDIDCRACQKAMTS